MTESKQIDDGGSAYPLHPGILPEWKGQAGMSLRDWFAGQVIGHLAACDNGGTILSDAQSAYHYADAMIAARKAGA